MTKNNGDTTTSIRRLTPEEFGTRIPALADVLVDAVAGGASVGFLAGLDHRTATAWWHDQAAAVTDGTLTVWVALHRDVIAGTVTLARSAKPNARHRAEVVKLAVHRDHRGRGVGRQLLTAAEHAAGKAGVSLLLLDTETGSTAERLYRSTGWQRYGVVPDYAADPGGTLRDCSFYYKAIPPPR